MWPFHKITSGQFSCQLPKIQNRQYSITNSILSILNFRQCVGKFFFTFFFGQISNLIVSVWYYHLPFFSIRCLISQACCCQRPLGGQCPVQCLVKVKRNQKKVLNQSHSAEWDNIVDTDHQITPG